MKTKVDVQCLQDGGKQHKAPNWGKSHEHHVEAVWISSREWRSVCTSSAIPTSAEDAERKQSTMTSSETQPRFTLPTSISHLDLGQSVTLTTVNKQHQPNKYYSHFLNNTKNPWNIQAIHTSFFIIRTSIHPTTFSSFIQFFFFLWSFILALKCFICYET